MCTSTKSGAGARTAVSIPLGGIGRGDQHPQHHQSSGADLVLQIAEELRRGGRDGLGPELKALVEEVELTDARKRPVKRQPDVPRQRVLLEGVDPALRQLMRRGGIRVWLGGEFQDPPGQDSNATEELGVARCGRDLLQQLADLGGQQHPAEDGGNREAPSAAEKFLVGGRRCFGEGPAQPAEDPQAVPLGGIG